MSDAREMTWESFTKEAVTGTMPELMARLDRHRSLSFADSCLRGVGMVGFLSNPLTGLIMLAAMCYFSPWLGATVSVGVAVSTATALLLGLDQTDIRIGLYGYNGALAGAGITVLLAPEWDLGVLGYVVGAAAATTFVMAALMCFMTRTWGVRPLALPMNAVLMVLVVGLQQAKNGRLGPYIHPVNPSPGAKVDPTLRELPLGPGHDSVVQLVQAILHGISQLFFLDSTPAGIVFLVALALCSRFTAALALLGSASAVIASKLIGLDGFLVYLGIAGVNGALVCIAIGGFFLTPSLRSVILGTLAAAGSSVVFGACNAAVRVFGLPSSLSLSYCLIVPIIVVLKEMTPRIRGTELAATKGTVPERRVTVKQHY
ncbi:urea transporter [Streptomyces sp900116325]|uniref:urea transporter n=1 Tax=Streptomyces sp. 900116325 TaxID=3154295 RepID=UPI0033D816BC